MQLNITNIGPADIGLYNCIAKNEVGITKGVFTVYGKPWIRIHPSFDKLEHVYWLDSFISDRILFSSNISINVGLLQAVEMSLFGLQRI